MTALRAGIIAGLVACAVLVGGLWLLNNTRAGLGIKCSVLNDLGACFAYELSRPVVPPAPAPTEDPAMAAARQRAEEERRRQDAADRAVREASSALRSAVDDLEYAADGASADAADLDGATDELRQAVEDEQIVFEELRAMIAAGSTGEFWVDDVSFKLDEVEFARDSVDFARDGVEFASYAIEDARRERDSLAAALRAAIGALEAEQRRYPNAARPDYSAASGEQDLERLLDEIDAAVAAYEDQLTAVEDLIAEADGMLDEATGLAVSVGAE